MMKQRAILASIIGLMFFFGCGGGDEAPPPQPPSGPTNQGFTDLGNAGKKAEKSCSSSASASLMMAMSQSGNKSGTSSQSPGSPSPLTAMNGQCQDDFMNMLMIFTTLQYQGKNGTALFANSAEGRQWIMRQLAVIMNKVGAQLVAAGVPLNQQNLNKLYAYALDYANSVIVPKLPPEQQGIASAELNKLAAARPSASATPTPTPGAGTSATGNGAVASTGTPTTSSTTDSSFSATGGVPAGSYGATNARAFKGNPATYGGFVAVP